MIKKLRKFWQGISPHDRRLIKWTAIICYVVLMISLVLMYFMAKHAAPPAEGADSTKAASHEEQPEHGAPAESEEEAGLELPPPPAGAQELLAGLDSFDTRAHRELSKIYAERQDFEQSLMHARRVSAWLEEDLEFQGQVGKTFLLAGSPGEAIPHLEKAIQLGGKTPDLMADRALAIFRSKGVDAGLAAVQEGLKEYPDNPMLSTHEAAMFGESKDQGEKGDALFQSLVHRFPYFAEARYQYGRFLMNQGNYASSLRELQQAIKLDPLDPRMHARLGMALFHLDRDAEAERSYKTTLAMNPRDYNTWFNLGELNLSIANETEISHIFAERTRVALEDYLTALAIKPDHSEAHFRVGVILNANRQNREALRHLMVALQADPQSIRVLIQIATAWEALGEKSKAWDFIQQAYELDPFNQIILSQYRRLKGSAIKS